MTRSTVAPLIVLLITTSVIAGCLGAGRLGTPPGAKTVELVALNSSSPDGAIAYEIVGNEPLHLDVTVRYFLNATDYAPLHVLVISEAGDVFLVLNSTDYDGSALARGDGVVGAGTPVGGVSAPGILWAEPLPTQGAVELEIPDDRAWLVVSWSRQAKPLSVQVNAPIGTSLHGALPGTANVYELKDFAGGLHFVGPARVAAQDTLQLGAPVGPNLVHVFYHAADAGLGNLTLTTSDGVSRTVDLTGRATGNCKGCYREGRAILVSSGIVTASVEYAGTGQTAIFVEALTLTGAGIPGLWYEADYGHAVDRA